ncbi:Glutaredoxin domain protein [Arthroderma uncinatum]|uniref:Glutaredoxin domain protein n=1 Tax=Arthroderma uncinatum TaxID=74035 RepID=UPI00144ADD4F|nr:Glutaredoxin domain protein [Arthroderma uncinatum]KAF3480298.1 Glutaredoxin domain protein [Arthroderma uncinatum]
MLSPRRLRVFFISALVLVCFILYFTGNVRHAQAVRAASQPGAVKLKGPGEHGNENDGSIFEKLKPGSLRPGDRQPLDKVAATIHNADAVQPTSTPGQKEQQNANSEDETVKEEMNSILKKSPVIIFSKSYCPYSKKAKFFLLEKYDIVPSPFVVELDEHPLGKKLQALLGTNTGRRTVPNVLVNGKSIGGGDEIETLYASGELGGKLQALVDLSDTHNLAATNLLIKLRLELELRGGEAQHHDNHFISSVSPSVNLTGGVKMLYIHSQESLQIPENGKLVKDLSHLAVCFSRPKKDTIAIEVHHGGRKAVATLRTVRTIINNLIIGVTRGFKYKMRYVYAHFPINVNIETSKESGAVELEIRNFLGEKVVRRIVCQKGVEVVASANVKDEIVLSGNSIEGVSQSAADIQQICRVRNKDIRKFLDGIYVSEKGNIVEE